MKEGNEPQTDLNVRAMEHFRDFVEKDSEMNPVWRDAMLALTAEKIPTDITSLITLVKGEADAKT